MEVGRLQSLLIGALDERLIFDNHNIISKSLERGCNFRKRRCKDVIVLKFNFS